MTKQPHVLVLTLLGLLFLLPLSYGQRVPDAFSYQGLARDANDVVLSNQTVNLELRVVNEDGAIAYSEITQATTNAQGRFAIAVGAANAAAFAQVNWGAEPYFLIVFLNGDPITYYSPLLSVPYAFAANTALDDGDKDATNELQNLMFDSDSGLLSLSNSTAPAVQIASGIQGASFWQERSSSGIYYNQGNIELKRKDSLATSVPAILLENSRGLIATYGENGEINTLIGAGFSDAPNRGVIDIRGTEGNTGVLLFTDSNDDGRVLIRDKDANTKLDLYVSNLGSGGLVVNGENGNANISLNNIRDRQNNGALGISGTEGNIGVLLSTNSNDDGRVSIRDKDANTKLDLFVGTSGSGGLVVDGNNNNANILLGSLTDYPNNGFVAVRDESGTSKAGIYVDEIGQGIVFADEVRDFTQDPSNENSLIAYSVLEGPEAAAYDRGNFQLTDGEAFVPYSRHFKIVANANNATVQLTSTEWDTYGLAVIRKTSEGFYVKELKGGAGNFQFDWEVKAVRKGQETYKVFIEKSEVAKITSSENAKPAQLTVPKSEKQE